MDKETAKQQSFKKQETISRQRFHGWRVGLAATSLRRLLFQSDGSSIEEEENEHNSGIIRCSAEHRYDGADFFH